MTFRGFGRLAVMLVAAAVFCALPAVAVAQGGGGGTDDDVLGGGNTVGGGDQDANTGDNDAVGGSGGTDGGGGGDAGSENDTGDALNQQQNAQNNCTIVGGRNECNQSITQNQGVGGAAGGVVSARGVRLARTGFDAWILAVLGGLALAGGLGMLAAQRRGTKLFKGSR